jgi:hypothetical protein
MMVRYLAPIVLVAAYFAALGAFVDRGTIDHARAVDVTKAVIALVAAAATLYDQRRAILRRPLAERWRRFAGITLALAALTAYWNGFELEYPRYFNRWDQFHYYTGAKYFRELGYDGLYRCTVVAEDEIGVLDYDDPTGQGRKRVDMRAEVRNPDMKIRNLDGDNLLVPTASALEHPEACKTRFSPARWEDFKRDVTFYRLASDGEYWAGVLRDHGYNPTPAWTMAGWALASMFPAGHDFHLPLIGHVVWAQLLSMLDVAYLAATFAALAWAFGWRVSVVAAVLFGCQGWARFSWTGGAFLRQDWLFWLVFSACLARKRWFFAAGASLAYASLLRVFPALTAIGWLAVAGVSLHRRRTIGAPVRRALAGGALATLLLVPLSMAVTGPDAYRRFYEHTLVIHDATPLTNHMGLRVLVSQKMPFGAGPASGRMKYTKDNRLDDPFEVWKAMRNARYATWRWVAWAITALSFGAFLAAARRVKSLWVAQCLAQLFVILTSQLTCYYYTFMILLAPLTRHRRELEAPIFGLAALSQVAAIAFYWNDDKYWVLTAVCLVFCWGVLGAFLRRRAPKAALP